MDKYIRITFKEILKVASSHTQIGRDLLGIQASQNQRA